MRTELENLILGKGRFVLVLLQDQLNNVPLGVKIKKVIQSFCFVFHSHKPGSRGLS